MFWLWLLDALHTFLEWQASILENVVDMISDWEGSESENDIEDMDIVLDVQDPNTADFQVNPLAVAQCVTVSSPD